MLMPSNGQMFLANRNLCECIIQLSSHQKEAFVHNEHLFNISEKSISVYYLIYGVVMGDKTKCDVTPDSEARESKRSQS